EGSGPSARFLETTTERRGNGACTGVSALQRGFGRLRSARRGLGAPPWFRQTPWLLPPIGTRLPWPLPPLAAPASRPPHWSRFLVTPPRAIRANSDLTSAP